MIEVLRRKFTRLASELDERGRRRWAASEARAWGHGGLQAVAPATGLGERTMRRGCQAWRHDPALASSASRRMRRVGGGRQPLQVHDPPLVSALEALGEPTTRGDPMSPLRWTCKRTRKLAKALAGRGHQVRHTTVAQLLAALDYRGQGTRQRVEGASPPEREAQLRSINRWVQVCQRAGQPVLAVDAKKKAFVGQCAKGGRDSQPQGQPERVRTHDVPDQQLGKMCPYGVDDPTHHRGWGSVGIDHDTAQCAVASIRRWWWPMGKGAYPQAHARRITAAGGGSNASRHRLWKVALQQLADEIGGAIYGRPLPPGTRKWNKSEHRMLCHSTENWRGRPVISHEVVVNLIGHTTTNTGLTMQAEWDKHPYPTGMKVSNEDMKRLHLAPAKFHGKDWNYAIKPRQ